MARFSRRSSISSVSCPLGEMRARERPPCAMVVAADIRMRIDARLTCRRMPACPSTPQIVPTELVSVRAACHLSKKGSLARFQVAIFSPRSRISRLRLVPAFESSWTLKTARTPCTRATVLRLARYEIFGLASFSLFGLKYSSRVVPIADSRPLPTNDRPGPGRCRHSAPESVSSLFGNRRARLSCLLHHRIDFLFAADVVANGESVALRAPSGIPAS